MQLLPGGVQGCPAGLVLGPCLVQSRLVLLAPALQLLLGLTAQLLLRLKLTAPGRGLAR